MSTTKPEPNARQWKFFSHLVTLERTNLHIDADGRLESSLMGGPTRLIPLSEITGIDKVIEKGFKTSFVQIGHAEGNFKLSFGVGQSGEVAAHMVDTLLELCPHVTLGPVSGISWTDTVRTGAVVNIQNAEGVEAAIARKVKFKQDEIQRKVDDRIRKVTQAVNEKRHVQVPKEAIKIAKAQAKKKIEQAKRDAKLGMGFADDNSVPKRAEEQEPVGTPFESRCEILADVWVKYKNDDELESFISYNDIGCPLAYMVANGIVDQNDEVEELIGETWQQLLDIFDTEDTGFTSLAEVFGVTGTE